MKGTFHLSRKSSARETCDLFFEFVFSPFYSPSSAGSRLLFVLLCSGEDGKDVA